MNRKSTRRVLSVLVVTIALAVLPGTEATEGFVPSAEAAAFDAFAAALSETAGSRAASESAAPRCGDHGHCNYSSCPAPKCDRGQLPQCACEWAEGNCADDHHWMPGVGEMQHPIYNCTCGCYGELPPDPPADCKLYDPLTGECITDALPNPPDLEIDPRGS